MVVLQVVRKSYLGLAAERCKDDEAELGSTH